MRKWFIAGLAVMFSAGAWAVIVPDPTYMNMLGGFIYNHGIVNPGDIGMTFTNAGIRDITISAGQLSGVDPETGAVITNAANLLPLKAQSLTAVSNIVAGGTFVGDGSGLTNLNVVAVFPTSGVWNASGVTISNATLAGGTQTSLTITSNLTVQGSIIGNGSGLTNVVAKAGGSNGQVQYNNNGALAGYTNLFVHPVDGGLTVREQSGNFLRMYNSENISTTTNLIVSLRNESGTSVLRLRKNDQDTIRLSGDGSAMVSSLTLGGVARTNWPTAGVSSVSWTNLTGIPAGFADGVDNSPTATDIAAMGFIKTNSLLTEAQVDAMVANNGYASAATLAPIATNANFSNLTVADGAIAQAKVNGLTNTYMTVAASTNYISTAQFTAGTSNLLNKTAASNVLTGVLTLQTNLLAQGKVIVGSPAFAQQTVSNATTGALIVDGVIRGDGSGLTNLNISASSLPTSGVWNAAGLTVSNLSASSISGLSSLSVGEGVASGEGSFAQGLWFTTASGSASHAEGSGTTAFGEGSHAEGSGTTASGFASHAEGSGTTTASGHASHAEGQTTTASGFASHAEGLAATASGDISHAEGMLTTASGVISHAAGLCAQAIHDNTFVWSSSDPNWMSFYSTTNYQFNVYADNGIRLMTGTNGTIELGGRLIGDGSGLTNLNVVTTETDPAFTNWLTTAGVVTGTVVRTESDPIFTNWLATAGIDSAHIASWDAALATKVNVDGSNLSENPLTLTIDCSSTPSMSGTYAYNATSGRWSYSTNEIYKNLCWYMSDGTTTYTAPDNGLNTPPATFTRTLEYPLTITVVGAGTTAANSEYAYFDPPFGASYWSGGDYYITPAIKAGYWTLAAEGIPFVSKYEVAGSGTFPNKTGWAVVNGVPQAPTLEYTLEATATVSFIPSKESFLANLGAVGTKALEQTISSAADKIPSSAAVRAAIAVISNSPASTITTNDIANWNSGNVTNALLTDGTHAMQANLDMGGHGITNISTDSLVYADGQSVGQKYVDVAGDTMTGTLTLQTNLNVYGQTVIGGVVFVAAVISNASPASLVVEGDISTGGKYIGDGSGLTGLNATNLVGTIPTNLLPPQAIGGGITNVAWGSITGTLSSQSDLANVLSNKADNAVLAAVSTNLSGHIAETNNPHQVTAVQVGAYTRSETDTAISNAVATVGVSPEGLLMNGAINMNTNRITNIANPVDSQDAVTKAYLEYMLSHLTLTPQGDISMGAFKD